jgi:hypothetical protein
MSREFFTEKLPRSACGVTDGRVLCSFPPDHPFGHSWEVKRKDRSGDQPLPVPNDGPSMHDLVCADLESGWTHRLTSEVAADLQARKQLGLDRYGSLLQAGNGRDALLDLYEELEDSAVYAKQWLTENPSSAGDYAGIEFVYGIVLTCLIRVRRLRDEH